MQPPFGTSPQAIRLLGPASRPPYIQLSLASGRHEPLGDPVAGEQKAADQHPDRRLAKPLPLAAEQWQAACHHHEQQADQPDRAKSLIVAHGARPRARSQTGQSGGTIISGSCEVIAVPSGLAVVAMKVVHPGGPGQAVGCETVSAEREITRMNLHKNARLTPQGRRLLVRRVTEQGWTVGTAARAAGLSERQAYRWLARYRAGGAAALVDRSSAPKRCPHEVPAERVAAIAHWRRQRLSGPAIARELACPSRRSARPCAASGSASWRRSSRSRRSCAMSASGRASCSTSTPRSSGASRRSAIGSPALPPPSPAARSQARRRLGGRARRHRRCLAPGLRRDVAGRAQGQRGVVSRTCGRLVRVATA